MSYAIVIVHIAAAIFIVVQFIIHMYYWIKCRKIKGICTNKNCRHRKSCREFRLFEEELALIRELIDKCSKK